MLLGLAAAFLTATLYVVMVRTSTGQRLDDLAFEGRKATVFGVRRMVSLVLSATVPAVLVGWVALLVVVVRGRRTADGLITMVGIVATVLVARVLKSELPRPELFVPAFAGDSNSFPSGHTAAVAATAIGALSVCRAGLRGNASVVAAVLVGSYSTAMLYTGWHRPIDVLGGVALATAVMAPSIAIRVLCVPDPPSTSDSNHRGQGGSGATSDLEWSTRCVLVGLSAIGAAATALVLRSPAPNPAHSLAAHLAVTSLTSACAVALVLLFAVALGPSTDAGTGVRGAGTGTT